MAAAKKRCFLRFLYFTESSLPTSTSTSTGILGRPSGITPSGANSTTGKGRTKINSTTSTKH